MAGHSKWATTKRHKAIVDAKRGAAFTRIGNLIAIAARAGADPVMNPSLAVAIEKAKAANMPNENIKRAIARVTEKGAAVLHEELYEAYGPGGVGILIEAATDNKNRTFPVIKSALAKNGGRIAEPGSVGFQFKRQGVIVVAGSGDDLMMAVLEAGAVDVEEEGSGAAGIGAGGASGGSGGSGGGEIVAYTEAKDLMKVRQAMIDGGLSVVSAELQYVPQVMVAVDGDTGEKLARLVEAIEDLDDVTEVYVNAEMGEMGEK